MRDKVSSWFAAIRRLAAGTPGKIVLGLTILVAFAAISWSIRAAVAPTRRAASLVDLEPFGLQGVEVRLVYPVRVPYHGAFDGDAVLTVYARAIDPEREGSFDLYFPLPDTTVSFVGEGGLPVAGRLSVEPGYPDALPYSLRMEHADTQLQPTLFGSRAVRITPLLRTGAGVVSVPELSFRTAVESRFGHTMRRIVFWLSGWGLPIGLVAVLAGTVGRVWYASGLRRRQSREQRLSSLYTRLRDEIKVENWPVARERAEELRLLSPSYRDLDRLDTMISTAETAQWRREQLYRSGVEAYRQRDWPAAVQAFAAIEEETPYYRDVRFLRRTAALSADLRSRDRSLRLKAAVEMGQVADLLDMSPLLRALGDASMEVADAAEAAFARIGVSSFDALIEGLTADRLAIRERCQRLLKGLGQGARDRLLTALHSPDPRVTGPVARLLGGLGARDALARALTFSAPEHHEGLIEALLMEEVAAAEPLVDTLLAAPEGTEGVIIRALSALRSRADIDHYLEARTRAAPDAGSRQRLQRALRAPAEPFQSLELTAEAVGVEPSADGDDVSGAIENGMATAVEATSRPMTERHPLRLPWPRRRRD